MESGGATLVSPIEGTTLPITGHKLNGKNNTQWAKSVLPFLQGKGKDEYVTGEAKAPEKDKAKLKT